METLDSAEFGGEPPQVDAVRAYFAARGVRTLFLGGRVKARELERAVERWLRPEAAGHAVFYHSDESGTIQLPPGVVLFRASAPREDHELVFPVWWARGAALPPSPRGAKPSVSFCGSVNSHPVRPRALEALEASGAVRTNFVRRAQFWNGAMGDPSSRHTFDEVMASTEFCLCPRGVGAFSIRFYEALRCGRIPVVVEEEGAPRQLPLADGAVDWDAVCVRVRRVEELPEAVVGFWRARDTVGAQAAAARVFDECLSPAAVAPLLFRQYEGYARRATFIE